MNKIKVFFKKHLKFIIGVAVLILVGSLFFTTQYKSTSLENANLQTWTTSPAENKLSTVQILTDNSGDAELIVSCVDKMSTFQDSGEFAVRDAVKLCNMGIQLRENN